MSILGENGREKLVSVIAIGMSLFHLATGDESENNTFNVCLHFDLPDLP